jgi:hypothetical protein
VEDVPARWKDGDAGTPGEPGKAYHANGMHVPGLVSRPLRRVKAEGEVSPSKYYLKCEEAVNPIEENYN